jgi:carbonic anhydrase
VLSNAAMGCKTYTQNIVVATAVLLACVARGSIAADSAVVSRGDWSYDGRSGPSHWGSISPKYSACSSGVQQSPLDIAVRPPFVAGRPIIQLRHSYLNFTGTENTFTFTCAETGDLHCGTVKFEGTSYNLVNIHFHSPSEHRLNGVQYALEAHFVHKSAKGLTAVVAVLFDSAGTCNAKRNEEVQCFLRAAASGVNRFSSIQRLFDPSSKICTVVGSLTVPPCTENVRWFISSGVQHVSRAQVAQFEGLVGGKTSRPLQPLNGRSIRCFA